MVYPLSDTTIGKWATVNDEIPESQRVSIKWDNINFYTPTSNKAEDRDENNLTGSVIHPILEVRRQTSHKKFK